MNRALTASLIVAMLMLGCGGVAMGEDIHNHEAFYYAQQAVVAFEQVKTGALGKAEPSDDIRTDLSNQMRNLIRERYYIKTAQSTIDEFKDSDDSAVKASSALISASLLSMEINLESAISLDEKLLNLTDKEIVASVGTFMRQEQELAESLRHIWELYAKASVSISYALVESGGLSLHQAYLDKKLTRLVITRKELNQLKASITTSFRTEVGLPESINQPMYALPALTLLRFLNGNWKARDEK